MQVIDDPGTAVAVYPDHGEAAAAVKALQHGGFDMRKLSIVGADYHSEEDVVGYYNTGDRMRTWGKNGAFWGAIWGIFFGAAFFIIPGLGPIMIAGPLVAAIVGALEGAVVVGAAGALGAGLFGIGIPKRQHHPIRIGRESRQVLSYRERHACGSRPGKGRSHARRIARSRKEIA